MSLLKKISLFLSILFIISLVFTLSASAAFAGEPVLIGTEFSVPVKLNYDSFSFNAVKSLNLSPVTPVYSSLCPSYRSLLGNEIEKKCYDMLCSATFYDAELDAESNTYFTELKVPFDRYLTEQERYSVSIQHIADAFFLDHPETFWMQTVRLAAYSYRLADNSIGYELSIVIYHIDGIDKSREIYNGMYNTIADMDLEADTRYEFLKKLHDQICEMTVYTWGTKHCGDPSGVLYEGLAVCEGYAEAFKLVCDLNRIPCILVIGSSYGELHMWNCVQMDDGKWYMLDATWDDQDNFGTLDDYFLCGLDSRDVSFDEELFTESHTAATSHGRDTNLTIVYPQFSTTAYTLTSQNQYSHFSLTSGFYADYSSNILYTLPDNDFDAVYYNGLWVPMNSRGTGAQFEAKTLNEHTAEQWTLAVYGDLDGDGDFDANDYSLEVNAALGSQLPDSLFKTLADTDGDGVLDVLDCALFERALNGDYSCFIIN